MTDTQRLLGTLVLAVALLASVTPGPVDAQDGGSCRGLYTAATIDMMANCFDQPVGVACLASGAGRIEMSSGQVVEGAGHAARLSGVRVLELGGEDEPQWPLGSLTLPDLIDAQQAATMIVFGPATLVFEDAPDLPAGAAFRLSAPPTEPCEGIAPPGILVQSPANSLTLLRINGVDVAVNGMALIQPHDAGGLVINALARETILGQSGTVVFAGYRVTVVGEIVSPVAPYDPAAVAHIPTEVLPVIDVVPLPGNATVVGETNLHRRPAYETYTNDVIKAGLPVNVVGQNADGQWLYVRSYDGLLGWVPASVLEVNVPGEMPILDDTPALPVRPFGSVQGYVRTGAEYNNLRSGPGEGYEIVVTVPIWTDLALYGRSQDDRWLYVETLDGQRGWISVALISATTPYALAELPYPPETGG